MNLCLDFDVIASIHPQITQITQMTAKKGEKAYLE